MREHDERLRAQPIQLAFQGLRADQRRDASGQHEHAVARPDAERAQRIREAVRLPRQLAIREVVRCTLCGQKAQRDAVRAPERYGPVDGQTPQVQARGRVAQLVADAIPRERRARRVAGRHVRRDPRLHQRARAQPARRS